MRGLLTNGAFAQTDMKNTWATIMRAAKTVASGMEYVHGKRICHGDLNPSNILLKVGIIFAWFFTACQCGSSNRVCVAQLHASFGC